MRVSHPPINRVKGFFLMSQPNRRRGGNRHSTTSSAPRRRPSNNNNRRPQQKRGPKKDYIHPSKFVASARAVETKDYEPQNLFSDFGFASLINKNLERMGVTKPTPIQDKMIFHAMAGESVVGIADTGTGKTMAFALPVLHKLLTDRHSSVLILAPTRDLALQVMDECRKIIDGSRINRAMLIGGAPMHRQVRDLARRPQLVVGTPGRTKDHIQRGTIKLSGFNTVVLDEVDRMLDMGFVHDVREIISQLAGGSVQSYFFSATIEDRVRSIIQELSRDAISIETKNAETSENVEQDIVHYDDDDHKLDRLHEILSSPSTKKTIIFDDTRRQVEKLSKSLEQRGHNVQAIHGGKSQGQRKRALEGMKRDSIKVLVATDVAARGIDINDISHVINYNTPQTYDDYVHRIGRAGRANKQGFALTFIAGDRRDQNRF